MKRPLLRLLFSACFIATLTPLFSQQEPDGHGFCAQKIVGEAAFQQNPDLRRKQEETEQALYRYLKKRQESAKALPPIYVLPVVVHIIHDNGPENISDATVIQGIQDLNDAYANVGYYDPATGVDTKIQFCLARRDSLGNLTS